MSEVKIIQYGPAVYEDQMPSGHTMPVATLMEILKMLPTDAVVLDPPKLILKPASSPSSTHTSDGSPESTESAAGQS